MKTIFVFALLAMTACGGHGSGTMSTNQWQMRDTKFGPECFRTIRRYGEFNPDTNTCLIDGQGMFEMFTVPDADHCYADSEESVIDSDFCAEQVQQ